jgi:hypothetical protein
MLDIPRGDGFAARYLLASQRIDGCLTRGRFVMLVESRREPKTPGLTSTGLFGEPLSLAIVARVKTVYCVPRRSDSDISSHSSHPS